MSSNYNLSGLESIYINYVIQLKMLKTHEPNLNNYAKEFITLLKYILNLNKNNIISELKPNIESILVTYILDLSNLLNNKLFGNDYLIRYENLKVANERISQIIKKYEIYGENIYNELEKLKYLLLQL